MSHATVAARTGRPHRFRPRLRAPLAAVIAGGALLVALAGPAWAHVEAAGTTDTSGITTVTFSFEHGCNGSPTKELSVQVPAGTTEVNPENPSGWTSTVTDGVLDWTGTPIPDTTPGEFVASMRIVGEKGATVFLPTRQICETGENDWIEKTDDPEADNAAPRIVLTETVAPTDTTVTTKATTSTTKASTTTEKAQTTTPAAESPTGTDDTGNNVGTIVGLIAVAVIVIGAIALYLRNRRPKGPGAPGAEASAAAPPADTPPADTPPADTP